MKFKVVNEDWDEEESSWVEVDYKQVPDSSGFLTDYTWYHNPETGVHRFIFGDKDAYGPDDDGWEDWEADSFEEAEEWFTNYHGFDEDELDESIDKQEFNEEDFKELDECDKSIKEDVNKVSYAPQYAIWVKEDGVWKIWGGTNNVGGEGHTEYMDNLKELYDDVVVKDNDGTLPESTVDKEDIKEVNDDVHYSEYDDTNDIDIWGDDLDESFSDDSDVMIFKDEDLDEGISSEEFELNIESDLQNAVNSINSAETEDDLIDAKMLADRTIANLRELTIEAEDEVTSNMSKALDAKYSEAINNAYKNKMENVKEESVDCKPKSSMLDEVRSAFSNQTVDEPVEQKVEESVSDVDDKATMSIGDYDDVDDIEIIE